MSAPLAPMNGDRPYVVKSLIWCLVVRGFQGLTAVAVLGLSADLINSWALNAPIFALVCCLMTFIVVTYALVTELASGANVAYNIWAVMALDLLMGIFWLSSMAANAALRATFKTTVDDYVLWWKRDLIADDVALSEMSALAGLSALVMLLHIATLVYNGHTFRMYAQRKSEQPNEASVEMKAQETPMLNPQQAPGQQYQQYPNQQQCGALAYQEQEAQQQQTPQSQPSRVPQAYDANYSYAQPRYVHQPTEVQYQQQVPSQQHPYQPPQ